MLPTWTELDDRERDLAGPHEAYFKKIELSYKETTKRFTSRSLGWCATGTMMQRGV